MDSRYSHQPENEAGPLAFFLRMLNGELCCGDPIVLTDLQQVGCPLRPHSLAFIRRFMHEGFICRPSLWPLAARSQPYDIPSAPGQAKFVCLYLR